MPEIKRRIKDSVFTLMFREPKYALQLYQSLHPEDRDVTEEEGILTSFLASRQKEVRDIMITLFDQERAIELYVRGEKAEGKAEGKALGIVQGNLEKTKTVIKNMLERGFSDEDICALAECSVEMIDSLR